jgi:hypothetical protein
VRDDAHPGLHRPFGEGHSQDKHFVPEGWEDTNRGACPCGELVRWDEETDGWVPDRTLRLLVLERDEANAVDWWMTKAETELGREIHTQLALQEPFDYAGDM